MKNRIKYLIFSLLIVVIMALCACGKKVPEDISTNLTSESKKFIMGLYSKSDSELYNEIAAFDQNGQAVYDEGYRNFIETREQLGGLLNIKDIKVSYSDGNYVVKAAYSAELGNGEMTLGLKEDAKEMVILSFTPKYSLAEKMGKAALNTVLGMGTVFIILIFISFLISLFKYISIFENKIKAKQTPVIETKENNTVSEPENLEDDLELVAVITAAIAEFSNTDASNLIVRSIKRVKR